MDIFTFDSRSVVSSSMSKSNLNMEEMGIYKFSLFFPRVLRKDTHRNGIDH